MAVHLCVIMDTNTTRLWLCLSCAMQWQQIQLVVVTLTNALPTPEQ